MAKAPQWPITLDAYHRFVVERFQDVFGTSRAGVVEYMVRSWVSSHPDQVEQAGASIRNWREEQGES
jgi:hypothetical protein